MPVIARTAKRKCGVKCSDNQTIKIAKSALIQMSLPSFIVFFSSFLLFLETGPLTYKETGKGKEFKKAIEKLRGHGGGDCPELTFKRILDAMTAGPKYGSPLYVFTDASATKENIDEVLLWAEEMSITINFFATGLCGMSTYKPFEDLAKETCRYMFNLARSSDLKRLSAITSGALVGATCLHKGGRGNAIGKKKQSTPSY